MIELILSGAAGVVGAVAGGVCTWAVLTFPTKQLERHLADVENDRDYLSRRLFAVGAELGEIKARDEARKAQCRAAAAKGRLSQKVMKEFPDFPEERDLGKVIVALETERRWHAGMEMAADPYAQNERRVIGDAIEANFIRVVRP